MKKIKFLLLVCSLAVVFDREGVASNFYVRAGASGSNTGADWNNAWKDCSSIVWGGSGVKAGDTLWFAGGSYTTTLIPGVSGTSGAWISIKRVRATDSVPASAAGWNSAYDSLVVISTGNDALDFNTAGLSYIIVDGRVDGGMQLVTPNSSGASVSFNYAASYITLTNLDLAGPGGPTPINMNGDNRGIDATAWDGSVYEPINHLLVTHCRIHGQVNNVWLMNCYNSTLEYTKLYDSGAANSTTYHANVCATSGCTNFTWRYNEIYNHQVEGIMCIFGGSANWYIYGNVWHDGMTSVSRILEVQDGVEGPMYFYNNTVVNVGMSVRTANGGSYATGSQGLNNIYWNSGGPGIGNDDYDFCNGTLSEAETHGIANGSNPFVNYSAQNYQIISNVSSTLPRNKGVALSAPFNLDLNGNVRGADGAWDIGAYEFNAGSSDTTPPTVSLTAPAGGAMVSNSVTLSATAIDNTNGSGVASVTFLVDGVAVGNTSISPYTAAWNSWSATNGSHTIQAQAQDVAGNQAASSNLTVTVFNPPDTTPPSVSLTAPAAGAVVSNTIALSATAGDNTGGSGVSNVTFLVDGVVVGKIASSPYSFSWNSATVTNGSHSIQARAQDAAGNLNTSGSVAVTVINPLPDTTPPSVSLTAPAAGAVVSNTITLSATASDNTGGSGVSNVTFLVDGVAVGSSSVAPYSIIWNSQSVLNGSHAVQARAQDAAGNLNTSGSAAVTVQNPGLTLLSGLVGYWPFDDASGTTAADSSGNGNTGFLQGDAAWGTGHIRGALSLDGQTGFVQMPSTPNLEQFTNGVTICGWVYFGTNIAYAAGTMQDVARKVISLSTNLPPYSAYDLVVQDFGGGTFKARMGVTRASDSTRGISGWSGAHTYGSWCYLAGVYDGSTVWIYVNGALESSAAFTGTLLQTGQPLCIGSYGAVGEPVNGLIDDLRVYNRALSAAEIQTLFNATAPAPPSSLIIQTN